MKYNGMTSFIEFMCCFQDVHSESVLTRRNIVEAMIDEKEVLTNGLKRAVQAKKTSKAETRMEQDKINETVLWYKGALKS